MAVATYSDLQAAVADYLNRADLTSVIPTFIQLAEAKFNRELRTRDMLTRSEAISSNEFVAMPADFLEAYDLKLNPANTSPQPRLRYVGPDEADLFRANKATGPTRIFTIIGNTFELIPAPMGNVDLLLTYYAKIPSLSNTTTTNWLLTKSPDLYLYSALLEATPYLKDDVRLQVWASAQQQLMDDIKIESERSMRQTTQLNARRKGFF